MLVDNALWYNNASSIVNVGITQPSSGSTLGNSATESIIGTATSSLSTITTLQWSIDGGGYNNFSFTPSASVSFNGGSVGNNGTGWHSVNVKAIDGTGIQTITNSSYYINPPPPSYSWTPSNVYSGQTSTLTISNAIPNATVSYTQTKYDKSNNVTGTASTVAGTTDSNGNFSYTATAGWGYNDYSDFITVGLNGSSVASFVFYNISTSPLVSYGPTSTHNGDATTLYIAGQQGSAPVTYYLATYPSNTITTGSYGSTSTYGNLTVGGTASWGTDTSGFLSVYIGGGGAVSSWSLTKL